MAAEEAVAWEAMESIMERNKSQKQVSETLMIAVLQPDVIDMELEAAS